MYILAAYNACFQDAAAADSQERRSNLRRHSHAKMLHDHEFVTSHRGEVVLWKRLDIDKHTFTQKEE
jgi:hypothetical protein